MGHYDSERLWRLKALADQLDAAERDSEKVCKSASDGVGRARARSGPVERRMSTSPGATDRDNPQRRIDDTL